MKLSTILKCGAVVSVALVSVLASAQRFGGRGMGAPGLQPLSFVLRRSDVKKDLALSADEQAALDKYQKDQMASMQGMQRPGPDSSQADRDAFMKQMQDAMKAFDAKLADGSLITKDHYTRLKQIQIQLSGNQAVIDPEIQTQLGLDDTAKGKIKDLLDGPNGYNNANKGIRDKMQSGELDFQAARPLFQQNTDALNKALGDILTDDQKKKLTDLGGPHFEADPNAAGGFGGGRRGGGGAGAGGGGA